MRAAVLVAALVAVGCERADPTSAAPVRRDQPVSTDAAAAAANPCAGDAIDLGDLLGRRACRSDVEGASGSFDVGVVPATISVQPGGRAKAEVEWRNRTASGQRLSLQVVGDSLAKLEDRIRDPAGAVTTRILPAGGCEGGFGSRPEYLVVEVAAGGRAHLPIEVDAVVRTIDDSCQTAATAPLPSGRYQLSVRADQHTARAVLEVRP